VPQRGRTVLSRFDERSGQNAFVVWAGSGGGLIAVVEDFVVRGTGNGQSIYALGTLDLSEGEPMVIQAPAGVQGFVMSAWQPLEDIGPLGPDHNEGGAFLLLPPGYDVEVPDGYYAVRCDTFLVVWVVRGMLKDGRPDAAVQAIKGMRIYPLTTRHDPPAMSFADLTRVAATLLPVGEDLDGIAYFEHLATVVQREPTREQDKQFLGMLAALGIEHDTAFAPDERLRAILTRAAHAGHVMTAALAFDSRSEAKLRWPGRSQWEEVFLTPHVDFEAPNVVELDARAALYYQALGESKGALLDIVEAASKYAALFKDADGAPLRGANSYQLRVPANVPAKSFWSVTVYDAQTRSMIDNAQGISGRDSYQSTLQTNDDGTVDLHLGPEPPADHEDNWIQTNPGVGFFLYFRWYGPLETYFDKTWVLPDVQTLERR